MTRELPSPELLRQLLRYEPETGKLFWRERPVEMFKSDRDCTAWNSRYAGQEAFIAKLAKGYKTGGIFGARHYAHRVIWAIVTGAWPVEQIDHIDHDPSNNRFENLREATRFENMRNRRSLPGTSSRYLGVSLCPRSYKWRACVRVNGKPKYLGAFKIEADAAHAYDRAATKQYGKFANLNFKTGSEKPAT